MSLVISATRLSVTKKPGTTHGKAAGSWELIWCPSSPWLSRAGWKVICIYVRICKKYTKTLLADGQNTEVKHTKQWVNKNLPHSHLKQIVICIYRDLTCVWLHNHIKMRSTLFWHLSFTVTSDTWIGLNDLKVQGFFTWSDEHMTTFTHWAPGEPNNHEGFNEDCVEMWNTVSLTAMEDNNT